MKFLALPCLLTTLVISGCAQDQEPADLATEYKNYVSFTLDSTEWTAKSDGSLSVIDEVITAEIGDEPTKRTFILTAWNVKNGASSSISLYVDSLVIGQPMDVNGAGNRASLTTKAVNEQKPTFITTDALHSGSVTVTSLDSIRHRVSGKFEFNLAGQRISNGTFDTRYSAPKPM
jgi:hypothetical protein